MILLTDFFLRILYFSTFASQLKTFLTRETMMQQTVKDAEGTLAFVTTTGSLFLKVSQGWKEIQVLIYNGALSVW